MFPIGFAQYLIQFAMVSLGNLDYSMSFYLDSYGPKTTLYRTNPQYYTKKSNPQPQGPTASGIKYYL